MSKQPKKPTSKQQQQQQQQQQASSKKTFTDDQIFRKFLHFLRSPVWQLPVVSFIEQRSIIFDKEIADEKAFKEEHEQFRCMIDFLIECFCEDVGITPVQVTTALANMKKTKQYKMDMEIFEPLLAVQDFDLFVQMMMRKNVELQLQALQMIEFMCGMLPAVLMPMTATEGDSKRTSASTKVASPSEDDADQAMLQQAQQDKEILMQIMQQSKDEFERSQATKAEMSRQLEEAMKASLAEKQRLETLRAEQMELSRRTMESLNLEGALGGPTPGATAASSTKRTQSAAVRKGSATKRPPSANRKNTAPVTSTTASVDSDKTIKLKSKTGLEPEKNDVNPELVRERQEYLRQQRDKLLKMKQEARQKAFSKVEESETSAGRPKTATAARNAMRGKSVHTQPISDEVLAARRALAAKLKQELM